MNYKRIADCVFLLTIATILGMLLGTLTACGETSTTEPEATYNVTILRAKASSCEVAMGVAVKASGTPYDKAFAIGYAIGSYDNNYTASVVHTSTTAETGVAYCRNYLSLYNDPATTTFDYDLKFTEDKGINYWCTTETATYDYHCVVQRNE